MKNVPHPNMFPGAGESAMVATADDAPVRAEAAETPSDTELPRPSSPWANAMLKHAPSDAPARPVAKRSVPKVADRVIELLGRCGPMKTKDIVKALDLDIGFSGIQPYVAPAQKRGEIVLIEHGVWGLPGQTPAPANVTQKASPRPAAKATTSEKPPTKKMPDAAAVVAPEAAPPEPTPIPTPVPVTESAEPASRIAEPARAQRTPVFQLSVGTAMLISWPDGSVTLQRGGRFVELDEFESRMLRMFVALQQK